MLTQPRMMPALALLGWGSPAAAASAVACLPVTMATMPRRTQQSRPMIPVTRDTVAFLLPGTTPCAGAPYWPYCGAAGGGGGGGNPGGFGDSLPSSPEG